MRPVERKRYRYRLALVLSMALGMVILIRFYIEQGSSTGQATVDLFLQQVINRQLDSAAMLIVDPRQKKELAAMFDGPLAITSAKAVRQTVHGANPVFEYLVEGEPGEERTLQFELVSQGTGGWQIKKIKASFQLSRKLRILSDRYVGLMAKEEFLQAWYLVGQVPATARGKVEELFRRPAVETHWTLTGYKRLYGDRFEQNLTRVRLTYEIRQGKRTNRLHVDTAENTTLPPEDKKRTWIYNLEVE